jgi:hypothetical protein
VVETISFPNESDDRFRTNGREARRAGRSAAIGHPFFAFGSAAVAGTSFGGSSVIRPT